MHNGACECAQPPLVSNPALAALATACCLLLAACCCLKQHEQEPSLESLVWPVHRPCGAKNAGNQSRGLLPCPPVGQTGGALSCILCFLGCFCHFCLLEICRIDKIKESIQPQVPLRLPCYDFAPVAKQFLVILRPFLCCAPHPLWGPIPPKGWGHQSGAPEWHDWGNIREGVDETSKPLDSRSVTGGEYKAQVQIHRGVLIHDY